MWDNLLVSIAFFPYSDKNAFRKAFFIACALTTAKVALMVRDHSLINARPKFYFSSRTRSITAAMFVTYSFQVITHIYIYIYIVNSTANVSFSAPQAIYSYLLFSTFYIFAIIFVVLPGNQHRGIKRSRRHAIINNVGSASCGVAVDRVSRGPVHPRGRSDRVDFVVS